MSQQEFFKSDSTYMINKDDKKFPNSDTRVTRLEAGLENIRSEHEHFSKQVFLQFKHVNDSLDQINGKFESYKESSKITWPLIFTCVATFVGVLGIAGVIINQTLEPFRISNNILFEKVNYHESLEGHPHSQMRYSVTDAKVKDIEKIIDDIKMSIHILEKNNQEIIKSDARQNSILFD